MYLTKNISLFRRIVSTTSKLGQPQQRNINLQILNSSQQNELNNLINKPVVPFSIQDLTRIKLTDESDIQLIKNQIKIRMSKTIKHLPNYFNEKIREERSYQFIEDYYHMNIKEMLELNDLDIFGHIETRLGGTTEMLSDAILNSSVLQDQGCSELIENGLEEIFTKALSAEVLVSFLYSLHSKKQYLRNDLSLGACIETAYDNARYLCEQHYLSAPELVISGNADISYFPSHLYTTFFELLKNSLRASVEFHGEECESIPPIQANIQQNNNFIIVKLIDSGGGYHKGDVLELFKFFKTSAIINRMSLYQGAHSSPMAGYGFGLGIVKIYMEHFGGTINLYNVEQGLCAELRFIADPSKAVENLKCFNQN